MPNNSQPDFRPSIRRALTAPCAPKFLLREIGRKVKRPEALEKPARINCCFIKAGYVRRWRDNEAVPPTRCHMPAQPDGFCKRHNPEKMRATAARNLKKIQATLAQLETSTKENTK